MHITRLAMEDWFIDYSFSSAYNLAESGVADLGLRELLQLCERDVDVLNDVSFMNGDTFGSLELRKAISTTYRSVSPDDILATTGMSEALFVFFNEILSAGDEVVVVFPTFQPLYEVPEAIGCRVRPLEMAFDRSFAINRDGLRACLTDRTRLVVLNSPHNPSGTVVPPDIIREIAEECQTRGIHLLVDEHYRFLPLDGQDILTSAADIAPGTIVTGSITKCFGLAALRVGWLIAPNDILQRCRNYKDYLTHVLSPVSDRLATLALQYRTQILERSKSIVRRNRLMLAEQIAQHQDHLSWIQPQGGAVCYPRYAARTSSRDLCRKAAREESVFVLPACCFGQEGHVRISLGTDPDHFAAAIPRFTRLLAGLEKS